MEVVIIGIVGVPACYGGFETLVENLLPAPDSINLTIFCSEKSYTEKKDTYKNAQLKYLPLLANGFQSILYDGLSLLKSLFLKPDVIIILGVSGGVFLPLFRLISSSRIIINIDGMEWKRDKWSPFAQKFLKLSEKLAVQYTDLVISDNQAIADYIQDEYGCISEVIAYGGDHALIERNLPFNDLSAKTYALALCRIEPENNVELILESFSKSILPLKFIGNWKSSSFGLAMYEKYNNIENICLLDPIYDLSLLFDLRAGCSLYIHGHSAGGTNPSLVEMMHFGKLILCFDCSYNRYSTENKAIYFKNENELLALLNKKELIYEDSIAKDMSEIATRLYQWEIIRNRYYDLVSPNIR